MPKKEHYVVKHPEGWAVKTPEGQRASSAHQMQSEAEQRAKEIVAKLGGGEVRLLEWVSSAGAPSTT